MAAKKKVEEAKAEIDEPAASTEVEPEVTAVYFEYSVDEILDKVTFALTRKADQWEAEASEEDKLGAANQTKMGMLRWGAVQLREIAGAVYACPRGEEREIPVVDPENEPGDEDETAPVDDSNVAS